MDDAHRLVALPNTVVHTVDATNRHCRNRLGPLRLSVEGYMKWQANN